MNTIFCVSFCVSLLSWQLHVRACIAGSNDVCVCPLCVTRGRCGELISYWQYVGGDKTTMAQTYYDCCKQMEESELSLHSRVLPCQLMVYSSPPLLRPPLLPNNSVLIREVSFGEREHYIHS